mmetsp:Transcript_4923/g.11041  ORF Transcript_4923/g.11041 Transcript_4923/m.11041 type:complete len:249 (-) Transcript_4923:920-1666(-)
MGTQAEGCLLEHAEAPPRNRGPPRGGTGRPGHRGAGSRRRTLSSDAVGNGLLQQQQRHHPAPPLAVAAQDRRRRKQPRRRRQQQQPGRHRHSHKTRMGSHPESPRRSLRRDRIQRCLLRARHRWPPGRQGLCSGGFLHHAGRADARRIIETEKRQENKKEQGANQKQDERRRSRRRRSRRKRRRRRRRCNRHRSEFKRNTGRKEKNPVFRYLPCIVCALLLVLLQHTQTSRNLIFFEPNNNNNSSVDG